MKKKTKVSSAKMAKLAGYYLEMSDNELWEAAQPTRIYPVSDSEDAKKHWAAFCKICRAGWASVLSQTEQREPAKRGKRNAKR